MIRKAFLLAMCACGPSPIEPIAPNTPMTPDPPPSASAAPIASQSSPDVEIGIGAPVTSAAPSTIAQPDPIPVATAAPDILHGAKPTILSQITVGPTPTLLHGYSDCHLGSGAEVRCSGPVDVELLSRDRGPVTSAPSPKDIAQREPTKVKLYRQSLCHDFYVQLKAAKPVKCDVAVHAIVYPD